MRGLDISVVRSTYRYFHSPIQAQHACCQSLSHSKMSPSFAQRSSALPPATYAVVKPQLAHCTPLILREATHSQANSRLIQSQILPVHSVLHPPQSLRRSCLNYAVHAAAKQFGAHHETFPSFDPNQASLRFWQLALAVISWQWDRADEYVPD